MELYCSLILGFDITCTGYVGDMEARASACVESALGYHTCDIGILTWYRNPVWGQCLAGSLTGAVASEKVTEAFKGWLSLDGNQAKECKRISQPNCETDGSSSNKSWS